MIITGHIFLIYIWAYRKSEVVPFQFSALKLSFLVYLPLLQLVLAKLPGLTAEQ